MLRACALAFALLGCKSEKPAPKRVATGSDPWAGSGSAAAPAPESPEAKQHRAEAALRRVTQIMPKLAQVRGLTFEHPIPAEYQSAAEFRTFVRADIAKQLPKATAAERSAALFHLGLLAKPGNLADLEEKAFTSQAGAYYDPITKRFFLVMVPDSELMLDTISAHELTHGLQDQHFDLQKFMPDGDVLDADHQAARRFVAEGDATFTMFMYAFTAMGGAPSREIVTILRAQLDQFAAMSPSDMLSQNVLGLGTALDPDIKHSMEAIGDIPLTVLAPMFDSYIQGAQLVATAYDRGSWKAVDALYRDPPESTEQALHPMTKLYPNRDHPKRVTLTKPSATDTEVADLVFGELQWQVYFAMWLPANKAVASEGWGGDRVSVIKRGDGRLVARIATVWDTVQDANELRTSFVASLATRFPKGSGDPTAPAGFDRGDGMGRIFLVQVGMKVFIVDGADDATALAELAASARID